MNMIALPIHQMSVTGLIVALRLLVDAGIVMTDEVGRRLRAGASRLDAVAGSVSRLNRCELTIDDFVAHAVSLNGVDGIMNIMASGLKIYQHDR